MAIGSAPEIGTRFVQLDTWEEKIAYLRQWRATVGDNGVGGYGTLVPRSDIKTWSTTSPGTEPEHGTADSIADASPAPDTGGPALRS